MKGNTGQDHSRDTRHAVRLARDGYEIAALKRAKFVDKESAGKPTRDAAFETHRERSPTVFAKKGERPLMAYSTP
jgi:hypothetical protein